MIRYLVIDQDLAFTFECETEAGRDDLKAGIELLGHKAIIRDLKSTVKGAANVKNENYVDETGYQWPGAVTPKLRPNHDLPHLQEILMSAPTITQEQREHILRAVHSYGPLLQACKYALRLLAMNKTSTTSRLYHFIKEAISKAEGE